MEKTPAASAMDWSIDLDKGLRSKTPGKSIEALERIGSRLEQWDREPELTCAEFTMFGLVPGEDKLFLNAILLRLADAFRFGNKWIKKGVVRIFVKMTRRRGGGGEGILRRCKVENYLELLRTVKEVFDRGDIEERALALVLFGCWSNLVKDCADVRYIVLSSLVSSEIREVKAALFAAGCLCEMSNDFVNIFLELLTTMIQSPEVPKGIKLAGGRAFAKIWCSLLADKAYKIGVKLLMDSSDEDFSAVMLISLSRIASRWIHLISPQIELLIMFLSEEKSLHMQATSLWCYRFILARGICGLPSTSETVHKLFSILHRSEFQPTLQLEALRILHKILLFNLSIIPCAEVPELFLNLLSAIKNMVISSVSAAEILAGSVLADLSVKFLGRADMVSGGTGPNLAFRVISFALDEIILLITPKIDFQQPDIAVELPVKSLFNSLFNLVEKHPRLCSLVLNNSLLFIDKLMKLLDRVIGTDKTGLSNHEMTEFASYDKTLTELKVMLFLSKIVVACLQNIDDIDNETSHVLDALKLCAENVCHCGYFANETSITYSLLLHMRATYIYLLHMSEELTSFRRISNWSFSDSLLQHDNFTIDCAKKMSGTNNYWTFYKAGKSASCQGAWSTAAFMFEQIVTVVQSSSCSCWIRSLAQFSNSERQIQLFLIPEQGAPVVLCESNAGEIEGDALKINYRRYMENFLRASSEALSAEEILAGSDSGRMFHFQRWFLTIRAKALKTVVDTTKLLDAFSYIRDGAEPDGQLQRHILLPCTTLDRLNSLINSSVEVSFQMNKLARELDLLLTSFMSMDKQSVMSISALALGYSLMAFTAGFAVMVPSLHSSTSSYTFNCGNLEEPLHALLVDDLAGRFRHIDNNTIKKLLLLLKSFRNHKDCLIPRFRSQISTASYEVRFMHKLLEYTVGEILRLQNKVPMVQQDGDALFQILNSGSLLLANVLSKLMLIPFRTPHQFFRVRPAISSELFIMNEDGHNVEGLSILSGSHLSMSLCLQLRNIPAALSGQLSKVYCILNCKRDPQITTDIGNKGQAQLSVQDEEIDCMMDLNEQLMRFTIGSAETRGLHPRDQGNDCSMVNKFVFFELNERGQGFCTCLLDVSSFSIGSYRIKWHSGCIDSEGSYWSLLPLNTGPLFTITI